MTIMKQEKSARTTSILIDIIMDVPFFAMLDARQLGVVANHMNYYEIKKGETLFKEGDPGDSVCFVIRGSLDVFKETSTPGQHVLIATVTKNKSIGEMAVIDEYTRSATVTAHSDAAIVALTKRGFEAILQENPAIGAAILKKIASLVSMNLRRTSSQLADYMPALPIT
ncbi:cyclic nucleotide-binding domain-containing protein [Desulfatitalea tepidiphila]|uniref:cyclic nucleotide-binding domain-containing protein n=1 Tax=Desulfatitalea tepidiphila TaxID=1185843 RepID=UPI0006B591D3|nr:cyclic nucleotide-binding domain-containing protein [Desulfatitalea tepidiphila]